jgi:hypothetical protein
MVRARPSAEPITVHAATLAGAAKAVGIPLVNATLEGHGPVSDPHEPLASGDALTFATA